MVFGFLAYLGGVLTILSPCILPVLPFVFSTAEQPFRRSGLPLLAGMALTFAGVSTLAVVGGAWVVGVNQWGRWIAMGLLSLFAITLLSPAAAEWMSRPFLRFGVALRQAEPTDRSRSASFLLGIATGFLWAPCAGPILGLILTGAALRGASVSTSILLLAYALGAATSLGLALAAGGKLLSTMKKYLGADLWVRRLLGVAVILGVATTLLGWDRGLLTRLSRISTDSAEQKLIEKLKNDASVDSPMLMKGILPSLSGATGWLNSAPLGEADLKGKVVLIDFWTYSCINCLRTLPYLKAWSDKYRDSGLVIIGVHTPEFAFEKDPENVRKSIKELGITYPVALDSAYRIWNAFNNRYWPAHYFIDVQGNIRDHHFGEGEYDRSEALIQSLLKERTASVPTGRVQVNGSGALAAGGTGGAASPETYIGYGRSENQISQPPVQHDIATVYALPKTLMPNQWALGGEWTVEAEHATLNAAPGAIIYLFRARDLHLVMGPSHSGKPIRFRVSLDGAAPGAQHGSDIDAQGFGVVHEQRLYQLLRLQDSADPKPRFFQIQFFDPGVEAFAFTFG